MGRLVTVTESETARIRETRKVVVWLRLIGNLRNCLSLLKLTSEFIFSTRQNNMHHGLLTQIYTITVAYTQYCIPDPSSAETKPESNTTEIQEGADGPKSRST